TASRCLGDKPRVSSRRASAWFRGGKLPQVSTSLRSLFGSTCPLPPFAPSTVSRSGLVGMLAQPAGAIPGKAAIGGYHGPAGGPLRQPVGIAHCIVGLTNTGAN